MSMRASCSTILVESDGENDLLVPVEDLDALTVVLERLIQDASLRRRMGKGR